VIRRLLKNLRQKPKATRDSIAFSVAGSFTAIIFVVWLYQLPSRIDQMKSEHEGGQSGFAQLFTSIKDQFGTGEEVVTEDEIEGGTTLLKIAPPPKVIRAVNATNTEATPSVVIPVPAERPIKVVAPGTASSETPTSAKRE
jgi:hypothetical protein